MAIISFGGFTPSVQDGSLSVSVEEHGPASPSYRGYLRDAVRARRRTWKFTVPVDTAANGDALADFILGRGHHFAFDTSLYSDGGLGPQSGYAASLGTAAPAPKFGSRRVQVNSATTLSWVMSVPRTGSWTMAWWFYNGASWDHWAVTSNNTTLTYYKNGVGTTAPGNYSVTESSGNGTFSLLGKNVAGTNQNSQFDDLVILPWPATSTMVTAWAAATSAFHPLPYLYLSGDVLTETGPVQVRGAVRSLPMSQGAPSSGWANNLRSVDVELVERQPYR